MDLLVDIREISAAGLSVTGTLELAALKQALVECDFEAAAGAAVEYDVRLSRCDPYISARGWVSGWFHVRCVRCLRPASVQLDRQEISASFQASTQNEDMPTNLELVEADLDVLKHDGQKVDVGDLLRQALVLAIPIAPLCRSDCAGICAQCGANRNEGQCDCQGGSSSRWQAALAAAKRKLDDAN